MAMTATYTNGTLKITKGEKGANDLNYNSSAAAVASVAAAGTYGDDAKKIDASALGAAVQLNATVAGYVTEVIGGKGADTITVVDPATSNTDPLNVTLGAGNDVLVLEGTKERNINVADFSSAGIDSIHLGTGFSTDAPEPTFGARDITLQFIDTANSNTKRNVKLTGGENKLIAITQGTATLFEQSFQRAAQPVFKDGVANWDGTIYTADNSNTGKNLNINTAYVDASARSTALTITAGDRTKEVTGGKGADTIKFISTTANGATVATGKGNDTVQVEAGNKIIITDFTTGDKADAIQLGAGLDTVTVKVGTTEADNKDLTFTISNSTNAAAGTATLVIKNGLWDQIVKSSTKTIRFVDSNGAPITALSTAYGDPSELVYSEKINKKDNVFDFQESIVAGNADRKLGTVTLGTDVAKISFNTSTALRVNAGSAGTNSSLKEIVGGKGKDTMIGGDKAQTLYGGKGNDYLYSGEYYDDSDEWVASDIKGDDGNDTLRGSHGASVTGGVGNDTFLLSGDGGGIILDYYAGTDKATKKLYGTDKLVLANDKWAAKNTYLNARTSVTGGGLGTDAQGNVYLGVQFEGTTWGEAFTYIDGEGTATVEVSVPASFDMGYSVDGTYKIYSKDADGKFAKPEAVTIVDQGITYNMDLTNTDTAVEVSANYLGLITGAKSITAASTNKKALRLVAGDATTVVAGGTKADTLIGNGDGVLLTGNAGNDIFIVSNGDKISDYSASGTNGKDKIMFKNGFDAIYSAEYDGASLKVGGVNLGALAAGTAVTFQQVTETPTWNAKKGVYTGSKKVTDIMTRTFSTSASDSILSVGASTYMRTFEGLDDNVKTINGAKKAVHIDNLADNVTSIQGSGKVDTIEIGATSDTSKVITLSSGKGNDIIFWNGDSDAVIADYGKGSVGKKVNTGDIIVANLDSSKDSIKALFSNDTSSTITETFFEFDGSDVILKKGNRKLTLKNAKDAAARIVNLSSLDEFSATATVGASDMVTLTNIHEVKNAANGIYDGNDPKYADTYIVDGSNYKKGNSIVGGAYFTQMNGGAGADTIIAGEKNATMRGNAGADLFIVGAIPNTVSATPTYTIVDYETGKDKVILDGDNNINILWGEVKENSSYEPKVTKKTTTYYSDVTLHLTGGRILNIDKLDASNLAITRADSLSAKAPTYSMVYGSSEVTVTAASAAKGATVNLAGVGEYKNNKLNLNVVVDDKRKTAVGFEGAAADATVSAGSGAAVTFYGSSNAAVYNGNAKADIYVGGGKADTVNLGAGANTIMGGGHAIASVGADASNMIVVNEGDDFVLQGFSNNGKKAIDKIALDSNWTKGGVTSVSFSNNGNDLEFVFSSDTTAATVTEDAKIKLAGYTGVGVGVNQLSYNAKNKAVFTSLSNLSYGHGSTEADINKLVSVAGSAAADTIQVYDDIATVTGGKGKDTFVITSSMKGVTITDYTSGDDVISLGSGVGFGTSADVTTLTDYDINVYSYLGGDDATLKTNKGNIVLQGVGNAKGTGTGAITIGTTKIASLSNQQDIVLTNKAEASNFNFDETKTFDGTKSTKQLTFTAKENFKSYKGSNNGDTVIMGATVGDGVTLGSGNDNLTLSTNKGKYTYTGGTDKFTGATANGANIDLALGNGWSITGATSTNKGDKLTSATINLTGKSKATGSIEINGGSNNVFTVSYSEATKKAGDNGTKGTGADSDTTYFTWTRNVLISATGASDNLKNIVLATQTSTNTAATAATAEFSHDYDPASFEERFSDFAELVDDYVAADELSEVVTPKADISANDFKVDTSPSEALKVAPATASYLKTNKKE